MAKLKSDGVLSRWLNDYGMFLVLLALGTYYSLTTITVHQAEGADAGTELAEMLTLEERARHVLLIVTSGSDDQELRTTLEAELQNREHVLEVLTGTPVDVGRRLRPSGPDAGPVDIIACSSTTSRWPVVKSSRKLPHLSATRYLTPAAYSGSTFLEASNLRNIADQISVIAILAVGMTLVIITAGIDLSVGSLIALSAVIFTYLIREHAGAEEATSRGLILCGIAAVLLCGISGLISGAFITMYKLPPFIATLAMMMVASGLANIIAENQTIYQVPESINGLGRGRTLGVPNSVVLLFSLYAVTHWVMSRTTFGRRIYAIGGNAEAARLSGVPVRRLLCIVYTLSGLLAGLGGVVMASQLESGAPTFGRMYELFVIAAVVVGGTSLSGGQGRIIGTLIGAFIIAVIQNGMNLQDVESNTQIVVLGLVILGALLLDNWKRGLLAPRSKLALAILLLPLALYFGLAWIYRFFFLS